jgi:hypothetical protein
MVAHTEPDRLVLSRALTDTLARSGGPHDSRKLAIAGPGRGLRGGTNFGD